MPLRLPNLALPADVTELTVAELRALQAETPRPSKYGNVPTAVDAGVCDSQAEATRWAELQLLERAGAIQGLAFHPRYLLVEKAPGRRAVWYEADSSYTEGGRLVAEDVKGGRATQTPLFRLKAKLMAERHPHIELRIVER